MYEKDSNEVWGSPQSVCDVLQRDMVHKSLDLRCVYIRQSQIMDILLKAFLR